MGCLQEVHTLPESQSGFYQLLQTSQPPDASGGVLKLTVITGDSSKSLTYSRSLEERSW